MPRKIEMCRAILMALTLASLASAQDAENVAIFHRQRAIVATCDGIRAAAELKDAFAGELARLESEQKQLVTETRRLRRMHASRLRWLPGESGKRKRLSRRIAADTKTLQRGRDEDAAIFEKERSRIYAILDGRMTRVVENYARQNGFSRIVDSASQTPGVPDLTQEIIRSYDKEFTGTTHPVYRSLRAKGGAAALQPG